MDRKTFLESVRAIAVNSGDVRKTEHCLIRMEERNITDHDLFLCLRNGQINDPDYPSQNEEYNWECKLRHVCSGRNIAVVAILSEFLNKKVIFVKTVI